MTYNVYGGTLSLYTTALCFAYFMLLAMHSTVKDAPTRSGVASYGALKHVPLLDF